MYEQNVPEVWIDSVDERRDADEELLEKLDKSIEQLNTQDQELLNLVYFEQLPQQKIAEQLGTTAKAVESKLPSPSTEAAREDRGIIEKAMRSSEKPALLKDTLCDSDYRRSRSECFRAGLEMVRARQKRRILPAVIAIAAGVVLLLGLVTFWGRNPYERALKRQRSSWSPLLRSMRWTRYALRLIARCSLKPSHPLHALK